MGCGEFLISTDAAYHKVTARSEDRTIVLELEANDTFGKAARPTCNLVVNGENSKDKLRYLLNT